MEEYRLIDIHFISRRYVKRARQFRIASDERNALNVEYIPRFAFRESSIPNFGRLEDACQQALGDAAPKIAGCLFVGVLAAADPRPIGTALRRAFPDMRARWTGQATNDPNDVFHTLSLAKVDDRPRRASQ